MILSALESGGQGRNRTADASLFRAAIFQSYLVESIELDAVFHLEKLRLSATKCNQQARSDLLRRLLVDARSIFYIWRLVTRSTLIRRTAGRVSTHLPVVAPGSTLPWG